MRMPPLIDQDEANHDYYGSLIASVVCIALIVLRFAAQLASLHSDLPLWAVGPVTQVAVILVAAWKEWIYDAHHTDVHTVDPQDFWATFVGGLKVTLPALLVGLAS